MTVVLAYDAITRGRVAEKDIYIATFYREQRAIITALVANINALAGVAVVTVDGSQGRERDLVILDCVRFGEPAGESMGFLGTERRRFNVAMSRARLGLVVVGHTGFAGTKSNGAWAAYLRDHVRDKQLALRDDGSFLGYAPRGFAQLQRDHRAAADLATLAGRLEAVRQRSFEVYAPRLRGSGKHGADTPSAPVCGVTDAQLDDADRAMREYYAL